MGRKCSGTRVHRGRNSPTRPHHLLLMTSDIQDSVSFGKRQREKFCRSDLNLKHQDHSRGGGGGDDSEPETSLDHLKVVQNGHDVLRHEDVAGVNGHAGDRDQQGVWGGAVKEKLQRRGDTRDIFLLSPGIISQHRQSPPYSLNVLLSRHHGHTGQTEPRRAFNNTEGRDRSRRNFQGTLVRFYHAWNCNQRTNTPNPGGGPPQHTHTHTSNLSRDNDKACARESGPHKSFSHKPSGSLLCAELC